MSRDDPTLRYSQRLLFRLFSFSVSLPEIRSPLFAAAAETQVPKSKNDPALPFFVGRFHSFGRTERVACFPGQKSRSGLVERFDSTTLNSWPWFGSDRTDHPSIPGPAWRGQRWSVRPPCWKTPLTLHAPRWHIDSTAAEYSSLTC